jgi:hypothetical protein
MLLTASDLPDDQVCIHWALSYFKSECAAIFAEYVVRQEIKSGQMTFTDWNKFIAEFTSMFCPENELMTALMQSELEYYFQGRQNVNTYTNEPKDLIDMSGYRPYHNHLQIP